MNSKTEEIVKSLRGCSADEMDCKNCVAEWGRKYGYCFNSLRLYAADRLEELEKELADERYRHDRYADFCVAQGEELSKLKAQQRWTPVADRLPEKFESVLVYFDSGNMAIGFWYAVDECLSLWKVQIDDGWYSGTGREPVYWMPLPERPKENE